jgi:hypothetical protein
MHTWKITTGIIAYMTAASLLLTGCAGGAQGNGAAGKSSAQNTSADKDAQGRSGDNKEEKQSNGEAGSDADTETADEADGKAGTAAAKSDTADGKASSADAATPHFLKTTQYNGVYEKDGYTELIDNTYDQLSLADYADPDTGEVPEENTALQSALDTVNKKLKKNSEDFNAQNSNVSDVKQQMGENFQPYTNSDTLGIVRVDERALVISRNSYQDTDGAHGYGATFMYSFNGTSGKALTLADVLKDTDAQDVTDAILKAIDSQVGSDQKGGIFEDTLEQTVLDMVSCTAGVTGAESSNVQAAPLVWYPGDDGVHVIFNQYDIAAYAAGQIEVTLKPADFPDLVKSSWFSGDGSSDNADEVLEILPAQTEVDGKPLSISENYDADAMTISSLTVQYAGRSKTYDTYSYGNTYYYVRVDGHPYLYINGRMDDDYQELDVIDLDDDAMPLQQTDCGLYGNVLTDPGCMYLESRTNLMSTMMTVRAYSASENGVPAAKSQYYLALPSENIKFTLKQYAKLNVLDASGSKGTSALGSNQTVMEQFQKGTTMVPYRTDGDHIMDCITSDGRYVRFDVDTQSVPQVLDGTYKLDELLDGTLFVG